ncbi:12797_t:CDS:10 [Entrophospora sp. SA101]|nr:12797_t:CDS:10 [Entrophospora sp. SA101]
MVDVCNELLRIRWKYWDDLVVFQQLEISESVNSYNKAPFIRMFGVTENGNSILCNVNGFQHYFYMPAPNGFKNDEVDNFLNTLEAAVRNDCFLSRKSIIKIEIQNKESLWGFHGNKRSPYLKITCFDYKSLSFMINCKVTGANWIELPPNTYTIREDSQKSSTCQLEVDIKYDKFISHPPEDEWLKIAPLRILSFDIECAGRKGIFPEAQIDPVIQIANIVTIQGEKTPFIRNVFTLNSCAPIVATDVIEFSEEAKMLQAWRDFVIKVDPDLLIGYNIANFDLPYLLDRANHLNVTKFSYLGRIKNVKSEAKDSRFSSKAYGTRRIQLDLLQVMQREHKLRSYTLNSVCAQFLGEQKEDVHHSIITDLHNGNEETRRRLADAYLPQRLMDKLMCLINYMEMARVTGVPFNYLLSRGQQIKVISQLFRKAHEEDLVIPALKTEASDEQFEGATVIEPLKGFYNVPITTLDFTSLYPSIMIAHNLCYTTLLDNNEIENLKLKGDIDYITTPQINARFVKAHHRKGLLPTILEDLLSARKRAKADLKKETDPFKRAVFDGRQLALKISANSVYGFTGATIGKLPCLEISSSVTAYGREMIEKSKAHDAVVIYGDTDSIMVKFGVDNLAEAMELGKKAAKHVTENFIKPINLEFEKIYFPYLLVNKKRYAGLYWTNTEKWDKLDSKGIEHDAVVIYGDTDSIMVKFGVDNLAEAMELGKKAAKHVTENFIKPINLEFEKIYFPYLLVNKKRYAGLYWTNTEKWDKLDSKGIETVRRDNCLLVQNVIETSLKKILIDRDIEGAETYVKNVISDLLQNKIDMSQLVITKALSKSEYNSKQPHSELAERMHKRDAGSAPTIGDRVAYVIVKGTKGAAAYEKSEDPIYVLENNIPIDTKYYLDNQLSNPLSRIFEPILDKFIVAGNHTRVIQVATPSVGGLMKFTVKTATCLGCKTPLSKTDAALDTVTKLEVHFARLWTQCQRCQGSLHQDILCSSKDCPIWYMRKKAQKDVQDATTITERLNNAW